MKYIFLFLFFLLLGKSHAQQITTLILVRHAEKVLDDSKDPELTEAGQQRALRLASLLKETKVDAIFSTAFKRTQNTVTPLAKAKGIEVRTYEANNPEAIDAMLKNFPGGTIVVCGHSNTIPWTVNYLLGTESYKNFDDGDYDNLLIVEIVGKGRGKVVWLEY